MGDEMIRIIEGFLPVFFCRKTVSKYWPIQIFPSSILPGYYFKTTRTIRSKGH